MVSSSRGSVDRQHARSPWYGQSIPSVSRHAVHSSTNTSQVSNLRRTPKRTLGSRHLPPFPPVLSGRTATPLRSKPQTWTRPLPSTLEQPQHMPCRKHSSPVTDHSLEWIGVGASGFGRKGPEDVVFEKHCEHSAWNLRTHLDRSPNSSKAGKVQPRCLSTASNPNWAPATRGRSGTLIGPTLGVTAPVLNAHLFQIPVFQVSRKPPCVDEPKRARDPSYDHVISPSTPITAISLRRSLRPFFLSAFLPKDDHTAWARLGL